MSAAPDPDSFAIIGVYDPNDPATEHLRPELDPANANMGTERGDAALEESLEKYGAGRSVLLDADNIDIAGNKTLQKWVARGGKVAIVETDGKTLIAVRRRDLRLMEGGKAQELAIADNRVGELNLSWDYDRLVELKNAGDIDLGSAGFTKIELEDIEAHTKVDDLDDLARKYGAETDDQAEFVELRLSINRELLQRYKDLIGGLSGDDAATFGAVITWAEQGKGEATERTDADPEGDAPEHGDS